MLVCLRNLHGTAVAAGVPETGSSRTSAGRCFCRRTETAHVNTGHSRLALWRACICSKEPSSYMYVCLCALHARSSDSVTVLYLYTYLQVTRTLVCICIHAFRGRTVPAQCVYLYVFYTHSCCRPISDTCTKPQRQEPRYVRDWHFVHTCALCHWHGHGLGIYIHTDTYRAIM